MLIIFVLLFFAGCATIIRQYIDNATHGCTHEKDGKKKGPFPVKIKPGMPTQWESDKGWKITCEPLKKEA